MIDVIGDRSPPSILAVPSLPECPVTGSPSGPLPARRLQDGGAGTEGFGAALPPGPAGTRPHPAPGDPHGDDGAGGDAEILGEERALQQTRVPTRQHLQVVPAHGHVHQPPRHRRGAQPGCVPVLPGRSAAPRAVPSLPGPGEGPEPRPCPDLFGQIRSGPSLLLPHLERDPAPGLGPGQGAEADPGDPVGGAGAAADPAELRRAGRALRGPQTRGR